MPEYVLDQSGEVAPPKGVAVPWPHPLRWSQLSDFAQGYIEALFFTNTEPSNTREECFTKAGKPRKSWLHDVCEGQVSELPGDFGFSDLAGESLLSILKDCAAFEEKAAPLLAEAYARDYDEAQAGRDFWFTRNGHGVGYWDREALEPDDSEYERLTDAMVAASQSGDNAAWSAACGERSKLKESSLGERLSEVARTFGESNVYAGDDCKAHVE